MTDRKFRVGERVRVDERYPEGHVRTPFYIRGKVGTIADAVGAFPDPEMAALGQQPVLRNCTGFASSSQRPGTVIGAPRRTPLMWKSTNIG